PVDINPLTHRFRHSARQRRIRRICALNLARTNRKFAPAKFLVRLQLGDHVFFRVRSPCSINFQNSRLSFSCSSSPVGSLVRKRKSRSVFLRSIRWTVTPSEVFSK